MIAWFLTSYLGRRILGIGSIVLAALFALWFVFHSGEKRGEEKVIKQIETNNAKVEKKVSERRLTVDTCYKSGGVWDRSTGKCKGR